MQSGHVDIIRTLCLKIWNEESWNGGGGGSVKVKNVAILIIFSIFIGLKYQFIEDWENWFWKKKKWFEKITRGRMCKCWVFIDINTHVSTLYSECVE